MATTVPDEKRELGLVEAVDFKIISASNNETKLNELLGTYLAPLLLKAGSPHVSVRNKVIGICARLKTFTQPPGLVSSITL
jgi:proteasome component ECM29